MPLGAWEFYTVLDDDPATERGVDRDVLRHGRRATPPPAAPAAPRTPDMATQTAVLDGRPTMPAGPRRPATGSTAPAGSR